MSSKSLPRCAAVLVLALAAVAAPAQGPPSSSPEAREKMKALEFMVGDWQGEAWSQMRPDLRETVTQRELVEWVAGGEALLVRGQGSKDGRVVHDAVGLIVWDARNQRYTMTAYRAGSGLSAPELAVEDGGVVWGTASPGGQIRFTMRLDEQGRWSEIGERSTDGGKTWSTFLGMTLTKK